jgi:hypothetical protein
MVTLSMGIPRAHAGKPQSWRLLPCLCLVLLAGLAVLPLHAQTAWTVNSTAPTNLKIDAKLKFTNNSFFLAWQEDPSASTPVVSIFNLKEPLTIATPYSLAVNYQNMGVAQTPGVVRKLTVRYVNSSGEYQAVIQDGSTLTIPSSAHTRLGPGQTMSGFVVLSATYGTTSSSVDVKTIFYTKNFTLPYSNLGFKLSDFAADGNGSLLLFGGGSHPSVAYQSSPSSSYKALTINSYESYGSASKACGAFGNGTLALGVSGPTYSYSPSLAYLLCNYGSPGYFSSSWTNPSVTPVFAAKQMMFDGGKFVVVGTRYNSYYPYTSVGAVLVSTDGMDWSTIVISGTTSLLSLCYDQSKWVAVGNSGAVLTSANGYDWTRYNVPGAGNLLSVASANGYCTVGSSAGKIYTSTDFTSWNLQVSGTGAANCLAAGAGKFMALIGTVVYQSSFAPIGVADIFTHPAGSFIIPQQSVMLSVGASGVGPLSYQWYQGASGDISQPISGATDPTYQTPPLSDSASYWVRASNALGAEDSQTAAIVMQTPPLVTSQPQHKQLFMGGSDSTSVTVAGNNMNYQWYKGYAGDVSAPLAGKTTDTLTLPSEMPGVSYYWVKATNDLGSVSSIAMRANVIPITAAIVDEPLDINTTIYGSFDVTLAVVANGPMLTYQWYGGVSGDTSHPIPATYSSFTPSRTFVGTFNYWVRVSNSLGYVDSRTAVYTVMPSGAPVIVRQPMDITAYVGSSDALSVSANAPGSIRFEWYTGEAGDTSFPLSYSSSFAPSYTQPGIYRYWVRVYNEYGSVDSIAVTCTVKPLGTGLITKQPLDKSTSPGGYVTLSVTALGSPLSYKWYSGVSGDTSAPLSSTSASLSLPAATSGQQSYWVRVTSGAAVEDSQTAVVKVVPPTFIITDQPLDGSTYVKESFGWSPYTSGTNITYQWYSGTAGNTSSPIAGQTNYYFYPPTTTAGIFPYWRRAFSGGDYLDTRTAVLTVIGRKPFIITQPLDRQFAQGSGDISLVAKLHDSNGASWQWYQGASGDTSTPLTGKTSSSLAISNPTAGSYSYWARATNPYGYTDSRSASIIVNPATFDHWLAQNSLPTDGTGIGAPGASPYQDGVPNLLKYAMGLDASERIGATHGLEMGNRSIGGDIYFTLEFIQSQTASGAQLVVEESADLTTWSSTAIECGPSYDNGDGTMTRTFRSSLPMKTTLTGYLRLKASSN